MYDFADANTDLNIIVGAGAKDKDVERYDYFEKNIEKYPLVRVVKIPIQSEGISGTKTRELIQQDIEQGIDYFVPEEVITSIQDRQAIEEILTIN